MFVGFASDNTARVHPRVMKALCRANKKFSMPYGEDEYTSEAVRVFRRMFGSDASIFLALNGTGANVLALRAMLRPWQSVICAEGAHINTAESGAPEWATGSKIFPVPSEHGKITPESLDVCLPALTDCHHSTPHVVSISQATERGTVYTPKEVRDLAEKAHAYGLLLHMDGTRIANAMATLGASSVGIQEFTREAGVDALSFGGTKNGLMMAEAVVFFRPELARDFETLRKQSLQTVSKMRYVAVQFLEALKDGLWLANARHANLMARKLAEKLVEIPGVAVRYPDANIVFAYLPPEILARLQSEFYFHETDPVRHEVRLLTNFETTDAEVEAFLDVARGKPNPLSELEDGIETEEED